MYLHSINILHYIYGKQGSFPTTVNYVKYVLFCQINFTKKSKKNKSFSVPSTQYFFPRAN